MKLLFYISILLFALQDSEIIEWQSAMSHDFGEIPHFEEQVHTFSFQNIYDAPIVIDNVRITCGCTAPTWSDLPILPDSIATIAVHYDGKRLGVFKKKIKVFVSGQRKAEVLEIKGEVL